MRPFNVIRPGLLAEAAAAFAEQGSVVISGKLNPETGILLRERLGYQLQQVLGMGESLNVYRIKDLITE